ncbi:amidohydrolase family protein [Frigidibacter sp. MR17.24]|uniref:amidohydrolase family protein n=1 Tax=Frigidibacter sp. MR17.24 TaxID=3127345 RepID=UPI0030131AD7
MVRQLFRNADWIVAWDAASGRHAYQRHADLVIEDGRILHLGHGYQPRGDEAVTEAAGMMISPGFVDIHSHLSLEPINKGYTDETGSPALYNSNLYEYMPTMVGDAESLPDQTRMACAELLMSGVTTIVDMSVRHDSWIEVMADSGLRACIAPLFREATWFTRTGHVVEYDWNRDAGFAEMEAALDIIARAEAHPSGRLFGMMTPAQIDTCSPELIRATHAAAEARGLVWQIHAAQSVPEFHEITRRHGVSPIRWLHDLGVLGPKTIVGHGIFLDDHPSTPWGSRDRDLALLAESGATVAHCPTVFWRRGMALQDFGRYLRAGVNMGIGTDTYPHNMVEEMRHVGMLARLTGGRPHTVSTAEVFDAATMGGARALHRDDIGRLAPGCRADFFMVDMAHPLMNPARDPLRSLVYAAADRAIAHVFVDGRQVVRDGVVQTIDLAAAAAAVNRAQQRAEAEVPGRDRVAGRSGREMSPLSFDFL